MWERLCDQFQVGFAGAGLAVEVEFHELAVLVLRMAHPEKTASFPRRGREGLVGRGHRGGRGHRRLRRRAASPVRRGSARLVSAGGATGASRPASPGVDGFEVGRRAATTRPDRALAVAPAQPAMANRRATVSTRQGGIPMEMLLGRCKRWDRATGGSAIPAYRGGRRMARGWPLAAPAPCVAGGDGYHKVGSLSLQHTTVPTLPVSHHFPSWSQGVQRHGIVAAIGVSLCKPRRPWASAIGWPAACKPRRASLRMRRVAIAATGYGLVGPWNFADANKFGNLVAVCEVDKNPVGDRGQELSQGQAIHRLPQDARRDGQEHRRGGHRRTGPQPHRDGGEWR